MARWEYRVVEVGYSRDEVDAPELDRLGEEGWEAAGMHVRSEAPTNAPLHEFTLFVLMKRPKEERT